MIAKKKFPFFIIFALCLFFPSFWTNRAGAKQISSPTILEIGSKRDENASNQFYIKGLTPANTEVLVYIDGTYVNSANVGSQGTESDNFYYRYSPTLPSREYQIKVIAQDKTSLVLSPPTEKVFIVPPLPAPTLIRPSKKDVIGPKPDIIGLSASRSFVNIYIDGIYNGRTKFLADQSGTADFVYKPFLNLKPGLHKIWAKAEDEWGEKSKISNILEFMVEKPMPAPTLFAPVLNSNTGLDRPFIVGLAKNGSLIKVYIDHQLVDQFLVKNHQSGTANFSKPMNALTRGDHLVYATATDKRGKESKWSNIAYFSTRQPVIGDSVAEEKKETVGKIEEPISEKKTDFPSILSPSGDIEQNDAQTNKIEEKDQTEKANSVFIDESKKSQDKLSLGLIIFIVFLLGIVGWILWVNRELAKEREEQNKKQKNSSQNLPLIFEEKKDILSNDSADSAPHDPAKKNNQDL